MFRLFVSAICFYISYQRPDISTGNWDFHGATELRNIDQKEKARLRKCAGLSSRGTCAKECNLCNLCNLCDMCIVRSSYGIWMNLITIWQKPAESCRICTCLILYLEAGSNSFWFRAGQTQLPKQVLKRDPPAILPCLFKVLRGHREGHESPARATGPTNQQPRANTTLSLDCFFAPTFVPDMHHGLKLQSLVPFRLLTDTNIHTVSYCIQEIWLPSRL